MYVYVDESGTFVPPKAKPHRVSAVGAVVVPETQRRSLVRAVKPLLTQAGKTEVKGSRLDESAVAAILRRMAEYDVIVQLCAVDMGLQPEHMTRLAQQRQAAGFTAGLTSEHEDAWSRWARTRRAAIEALPLQLFIQAMVTVHLLTDLVETASIYYSQRLPRELGAFRWRVDAKDRVITPYENLWSEIIMPIAQSRAMLQPIVTLEAPTANYGYFERFYVPREEVSGELRAHMELTDRTGGVALRKVFREDFAFVDSRDDFGVRMADVVVNAFTRAVNGTLGRSGWESLGGLLVRGARPPIAFISLTGTPEGYDDKVTVPYGATVRSLVTAAKPILR